MDSSNQKKNGYIVISLIIIMCLIFASAVSFYLPNKTVNAITADNIASASTNLGEMLLDGYEEDTTGKGKVFDEEIFWELIKQISGVSNPDKSTLDNLTTPKTSADFRTLNGGTKDVVVTIGKKQWIATYLSTNTSGEPILTLWLANSETKVRWNENFKNSFGKYPSNMYGTSEMRAVTLNNGGGYAVNYNDKELTSVEQSESSEWAIYTMDSVKGSLTSFIEVPDNMDWQHKQSANASTNQSNDFNNDALDSGGNGSKGDYSTNATIDKAGYKGWANDRLWLPSVAETGVIGEEGIWKANNTTRANSAHSWTRTAHNGYYSVTYIMIAAGSGLNYFNLTDPYAVRPAFHLNLKAAAARAGLGFTEPTDITTEYTGQSLTVADVSSEQKAWYDSEKIDLEYPTSGMKDADTYKVKATVKPELQAEGVKFNGTPDADEDDYTRYFNFTITKKKIGVDISTTDGLTATAKAGAVYSGDTTQNGRAPVFGFTYTSTDGKGYNSDTYPTAIGAYKATVKITNTCNYELDNVYTYDFTIDKREIAKPSIGVTELEYNGSNREFTISGASEDVTISADNGMTYADGKLTAKNAKTYKVTISLADHGTSTQWQGGGISSYEISVTITKATLDITFMSDGGWSWNSNSEKTVSITDNRLNDSDVLSFSFAYDTTPIDAKNVSYAGNKKTEVKMPPLATKDGAYVLKVTLDSTGDGENYTLTSHNTQEFRITDKQIEVDESKITWQYSNFKIDNGNAQNVTNSGSVFEVMYNGEEYTITVTLDSTLQAEGVTVSSYVTNKGKEVNSYTTTVNLTSTQGQLTKSSFELQWRINKGKYDLSNVKWNYTDGMFKYANKFYTVELQNLPTGLSVNPTTGYEDNSQKAVGNYTAIVLVFENADNNYVTPDLNDDTTYIYNGGTFPKTLEWRIDKGTLTLEWGEEVKTDENGSTFKYKSVKGENADKIEGYKYYRYVSGQKGEEVTLDSIKVGEGIDRYLVEAVLKESASKNYDASPISQIFVVGSNGEEVYIDLSSSKYTYDGKAHGTELSVKNDVDFSVSRVTVKYYKDSVSEENLLDGAPVNAGKYVITLELNAEDEGYYYLRKSQIEYEIEKKKITAEWDESGKTPIIKGISEGDKSVIEYEYYDENGSKVEYGSLEAGKRYTVKAVIKDGYESNYEFVGLDGSILNQGVETDGKTFEMKDYDPNDPNDPNNPNNPDGDDKDDSIDLGEFGDFMQKYWQPIVTLICIILILIFTGKGIGYASKRKKIKKTIEKKYSSYYAAAGTGLFGLTYTNWTIVACIMMGVMVLSFIFMLLEKKSYSKAAEELDEAKEEHNKMMFMRMMGGNPAGMNGASGAQGGYAYAQPAIGMEDMRGMISEVVTALLPGVQQMLPQQASNNDELVQKLIEQNAQNEEVVEKLINQNEKLMKQLAKQQPVEKIVEREVAATSVDNETILKVVSHSEQNDETIKQMLKAQEDMMRNQEKLIEKILELSSNQPSEPQVVEKIVEVPVEKIVEKEVKVEVPVEVEKVVEKVVEVPVEKIVEKEVVKEVPVEKIVEVPVKVEKVVEVPVEKIVEVPIEVEKVVEKIVEIPAAKPAPKAKVTAPRLTLDEAYQKLSAKQKKIFDTLRAYAMSKDKCKEKKSMYYILLGQSSVNPLVKLTIKKDTTVALFKMEDEFMKDIRRNATNDGTKVKVKETELVVGDMQALATAKEMVDLREDQIERYNEYLKEQRSMKK